MFDLTFYKLIKWVLNTRDNCKEDRHKSNTTRTITPDMTADCKFSILVLELYLKENTNISNLEKYMCGYFKYFINKI